MPRYEVNAPDGQRFEVNAPEGATLEDAFAYVQSNLWTPLDVQAKKKRTWGEAATDVGASLVKGVGQLAQLPGQVAGLVTGDMDQTTGLQGAGKRLEETAQEYISPTLKAKQQLAAQKIGQADGLLNEFGTAIKTYATDPALATSFIAEQLPNLFGAGVGGAATKVGVKAAMMGATKEALEATLPKAAVRGAVGTGAVMQGADIGTDTFDSTFKGLVDKGMSTTEAYSIALQKGRTVAIEAAGISLGTAFLPGGTTIERALVGKGMPGAGGFLKGVAGEALSEGVEEGGGAFAKNVNMQEALPETSLTKGVGAAAGLGALGGALFGGPTGAITGMQESQRLAAIQAVKDQQQAVVDAQNEAAAHDDQIRRDAYEAEQKATELRIMQERFGAQFTASQAYADLTAQVEAAQQKAAQAQAKRDAAQAKVDAGKADLSALAQAQPDLFGMVYPQAEQQTAAIEQAQALAQTQPGQMQLPLEAQQSLEFNAPEQPAQLPAEQVAPAPTGRPITEADFKAMGVGPTNKKLREQILGKDLADPAQALEVKDALENYAGGDRSDKIIQGVTKFLDKIKTPEEQLKLGLRRPYGSLKKPVPTQEETQNVEQPIEPVARVNEPSIPEPRVRPRNRPAQAVNGPEGRGVVLAGPVAGQINGGEGVLPSTLKTKKAPPAINPFGQLVETVTSKEKQVAEEAPIVEPTETEVPVKTKRKNKGELAYEAAKKATPELSSWGKVTTAEEVDTILKRLGIAKAQRADLQGGSTIDLIDRVTQGDIKGALQEIVNGDPKQFSPLDKEVASRLLKSKSLPKIEVVNSGVIEDNAPAQYNPNTDTVQIARGQVDSHTVLHETVHGFLHVMIKDSEARVAQGFQPNPMLKGLQDVYNFVKENPALLEQYGLKDLSEFASEAFSNPDFQIALSKIPYKRMNVFTAFGRAILKALGIKVEGNVAQTDALTATLIAAEQIMSHGRNVQQAVGARSNVGIALGNDLGLVDKTTAGYTDRRIKDILDAFAYWRPSESDKSKAYIGYVSPEQFLDATRTAAGVEQLESENQPLDMDRLTLNKQPIFLEIRPIEGRDAFETYGHEGRHRMMALRDAGIKKVPVVFLLTSGEPRVPLSNQYFTPQDFGEAGKGQSGFVVDSLIPANYDSEQKIKDMFGAKKGQLAFLQKPSTTKSLDDIDRRAGYSNVKPNPKQGVFKTIQGTDKTQIESGIKKLFNKAETMWFSSDAALNNAINKSMEQTGMKWDDMKRVMFMNATSQALHPDAIASQFLQEGGVEYEKGTYKWKGVKKDASWQGLIKDISTIAKQYGKSTEEMSNYAHRAFISDRLKGLTATKEDFYSHKTPEQIAAGMEYFEAIPELRELQKKWNQVRRNTMDAAIEGGLYSEKQAEELLDIMDYVPFIRIEQINAGAGPKEYGRGLLDFAKGHKIRGSEDEVNNIFDNMERWTSYTVSRAVKNRTALNLKDAAQQFLPEGEVVELRQDERVHREQNTIDIWENGQRKKYEFKDPLFIYAFQGTEPVTLPILKALSGAANILRKNIVLMPLFSVSQLSQDSLGAMFTSGLKNPFSIPIEVVKEFGKTLTGTSAAHKELSLYGAVGVRDYSAAIARNDAEIVAGLKAPTRTQKLLSPFEKFAMASDNAVRQAVYNLTMKETNGDKAAAIERAFEIINFKRSGASGTVQVLKQVVPFFGAYLQAQNVAYKTIMGKGISPVQKKEAQRVLMSTTAKIMALGFIYAALCADDDDYQKMDPTIRDRHLLIPGTGFMLPMRPDVFILPKLAAEYAYQGITDQGFTDGKKMRRGMVDAITNAILSPTVVPQAAKPILEVMVNYDFFTGRPIIGHGLENKVTAEQFTTSTSELAKFLGKTGLIAPVNIDHLIKGYTGTTGGIALQATSAAVNLGSDVPAPEKSLRDTLATTPGLSAFIVKEHGAAFKNDYYELRGEVDKVVATYNNMVKTGRTEEAKEFYQENKDLFAVKQQVNTIERQLTKLRDRSKFIYASTKMSSEEKGAELERIKQMEDRMLANIHKLRERAGY